MIFSHLFWEQDHFIFGAICKSWKSVTAFRAHRPLPFDFSYCRSPFLMALKGDRYNFFHSTHFSYYLYIPELLNKIILDSKYGWLLVAGTGDEFLSIFFFHPLTKEKIGLHDLPFNSYVAGFYSLPTSPECVVVSIETFGCIFFTIAITKPGDENWIDVHLYYDQKRFRYGSQRFFICSTTVFHNGKCYCLDENGNVAVFDYFIDYFTYVIYLIIFIFVCIYEIFLKLLSFFLVKNTISVKFLFMLYACTTHRLIIQRKILFCVGKTRYFFSMIVMCYTK